MTSSEGEDLWPPVPPELRPLLTSHLAREFSSTHAQLSEEARCFGRLLVSSSLFSPGIELERAKNIELRRQASGIHELDEDIVEELEKELSEITRGGLATIQETVTESLDTGMVATDCHVERDMWVSLFTEEIGRLSAALTPSWQLSQERNDGNAESESEDSKPPPTVVVVLGPSAAGKTYSCRAVLQELQRDASEPLPTAFLTIDGAAMRGASKTWVEFSFHIASKYGVPGFADLYESYFKPYLERLKLLFIEAVLSHRYSCVVPHTARDGGKFCRDYVDRFAQAGYRIRVMAVVASPGKCLQNGRAREKLRGKQYSDKYHAASVRSIKVVVNHCHRQAREAQSFCLLAPSLIRHATCWDCPYSQRVGAEEEITEIQTGASPGPGCPDCSDLSAHQDTANSPIFVTARTQLPVSD